MKALYHPIMDIVLKDRQLRKEFQKWIINGCKEPFKVKYGNDEFFFN